MDHNDFKKATRGTFKRRLVARGKSQLSLRSPRSAITNYLRQWGLLKSSWDLTYLVGGP